MRFQHTIYQDLPALNKESQARKSLISKFWDIRGEALKGSPYIVWSSHYKVLRVGKQEIETAWTNFRGTHAFCLWKVMYFWWNIQFELHHCAYWTQINDSCVVCIVFLYQIFCFSACNLKTRQLLNNWNIVMSRVQKCNSWPDSSPRSLAFWLVALSVGFQTSLIALVRKCGSKHTI